jgi:hypothetical protein
MQIWGESDVRRQAERERAKYVLRIAARLLAVMLKNARAPRGDARHIVVTSEAERNAAAAGAEA